MRFACILHAPVLFLLLLASAAQAEPLATDANLVTAIDVTGSIDPATEALEFDGIAAAVEHPAFLATIAGGYHRRVGFAAFTWSSHGHFLTLVPWTLIDSPASAAKVAAQLRRLHAAPRQFPPSIHGTPVRPWQRNLLTDVSATIEQASILLTRAPFVAAREVINLMANGPDNVADGPDRARAWAMSRGVVINGLVFGGEDQVVSYFRERVQCGSGSFVLATRDPTDIAWAMLHKVLLDLAGGGVDQVG
jgi:hypothetical protein